MTDEVRVTSSTGGEKGQKEARLGGADPLAMMELARVYGYGEGKYERYNYLRGYPYSLSIDALYRHFLAFQSGEDRDPESGLLHTAHVAWHALALTAYLLRGDHPEFDDRPKRPVEGGYIPSWMRPGYYLCASCGERFPEGIGHLCRGAK